MKMKKMILSLASLAAVSGCDLGSLELTTEQWNPPPAAASKQAVAPRAPCSNRVEQRQALFGDLHIHTGLSMDANANGTRTSPDDAYRYARGEAIEIYSGDPQLGVKMAQIDRPLDFAAVTDHAEWLAEVSLCTTPGSASYDTGGCKIYRGEEQSLLAKLLRLKGFRARLPGLLDPRGRRDDVCGDDDSICRAELSAVWKGIQASAERWYDRTESCEFTTFHGWEYSHSPRSTKLHRNVILRNEIAPELPISSLETSVEMDLRHQLVELCNDTDSGCEAIAIPHNPNLSNGQMFKIEYADLPLEQQRQEAALRARLEPVVEMMQIKGESECRNGMYQVVGAPDELCDFEKIRDMGQQEMEDCEEGSGSGAQAGKGCTSRTDYVRYALLEGEREEQRIGTNPYAFGFIGSTDNHMSTPGGVSEYGQPLKYGITAEAILSPGKSKRAPAFWNPGGLAGVWAEDNSRDAIFDALLRRETFATSGPRIVPRFFAGFNLSGDICDARDFALQGYDQGVAMGGTIKGRKQAGQSPTFAVSAMADSGTGEQPGNLLQRLQIIKGWVGADGQFYQKVHDIAGSPGSAADLDLDSCQPSAKGAAALCGVWQDPEFDGVQDAVYYARIIENPSCRWTTRLCNTLPEGQRPQACNDERVPKTIQERAWTSPIWYEGIL